MSEEIKDKIKNLRKDYSKSTLSLSGCLEDPMDQFKKNFQEACDLNIDDANAMVLSTVSSDSKPSSRVVLCKEVSNDGFIFYTNYSSRKGEDLESNPSASILFYWKELERQIRIEGSIKKIDRNKSKEYFESRPKDAKIAAIISKQSSSVKSRKYLEDKFQEKSLSQDLTCPKNWGGYILEPCYFEFWQGRVGRLHDRIVYRLSDTAWKIERLYP